MEFILLIFLIAGGYYFRNRISRLESRLDQLEGGEVRQASRPIPAAPSGEMQFTPEDTDHSENYGLQPDLQQPSAIERFVEWSKHDFMVKLGALLLLLAIGWFVSYSFAHDWIDEQGRIALGLFMGTVFLGLGTWRMRQFPHQGGIFTIVGATTVLLTIFAARELYDMFTPISSLVLMFITVAFVAFVSVRYHSEKLAMFSLLLGGLAPFLTNAPVVDVVVQLTYILIVVLGTLWVVWFTGWTRLILASLVITYLYSLPFMVLGVSDKDVVIMYSFIFVSLFFVTNIISLVRRRKSSWQHETAHTITALGTAIFLITWIELAAEPEWRSLLYVTWSLVFALGSYVAYVLTTNRSAFYLYGATSIALIGVATASELDGPTLTIAFLFEVSLLIIAAAKLAARPKLLAILSCLLAVPVLFSIDSLLSYDWRDSIFHEHFVVVSLTAIVLLAVGLFLKDRQTKDDSGFLRFVSLTILVGSGFYAMSLVWLVLHALLADDLATMLSLIVYTIAGISFFVYGKVKEDKFILYIGIIIVGLVIARLLLVEVQFMNIVERIITFSIIGVMLLSTAFIKKLQSSQGEEIEDKTQ